MGPSFTDSGCDMDMVSPMSTMPISSTTNNINNVRSSVTATNLTLGQMMDRNLSYTVYGSIYMKDGDHYSSKNIAVKLTVGNKVAIKTPSKKAVKGYFLSADAKYIYLVKSQAVIDNIVNMVMYPPMHATLSAVSANLSGNIIRTCGKNILTIPHTGAGIQVISSRPYDWGVKREALLKKTVVSEYADAGNYLPAVHDPVLKGNGSAVNPAVMLAPTIPLQGNSNPPPAAKLGENIQVMSDILPNEQQLLVPEEENMSELAIIKKKVVEQISKERPFEVIKEYAARMGLEESSEDLAIHIASLILSSSPGKEDRENIKDKIFESI